MNNRPVESVLGAALIAYGMGAIYLGVFLAEKVLERIELPETWWSYAVSLPLALVVVALCIFPFYRPIMHHLHPERLQGGSRLLFVFLGLAVTAVGVRWAFWPAVEPLWMAILCMLAGVVVVAMAVLRR